MSVQQPEADEIVDVAQPDASHETPLPYRPDPCRTGCDIGTGVEYRQWYLDAVGASDRPAAMAESVVVAVLDGGIQLDHPDLVGRVRRAECSPVAASTLDLEHGTNIAGLIVAGDGDGFGLAVAVTGIHILDVPVVFVDDDLEFRASASALAAGIECAVSRGVGVINLSMAGSCAGTGDVAEALARAEAAGVVVIAAAGNVDLPTQPCPGAFDTVVAVSAARADGSIVAGGRWGQISAPGFELVTASARTARDHTVVSGTSFAAPLVAATTAAIIERHPEWSPERVRARLLAASLESAILSVPAALDEELFAAVGVTADGHLVAVGDTVLVSSSPLMRAPTLEAVDVTLPRCGGYLVAGADGGVFALGGAAFQGSLGGIRLAAPVVAISPSPTGLGYWMAAADGGVFAFGDADFMGSLGAVGINSPIVDMAVTLSGDGYWLLAADGEIYSFGNAAHHGSVVDANSSMVGISASVDGYVISRSDGTSIGLGADTRSWMNATSSSVIDVILFDGAPVRVLGTGEFTNATDGRRLGGSLAVVAAERARPESECSGSASIDADQSS